MGLYNSQNSMFSSGAGVQGRSLPGIIRTGGGCLQCAEPRPDAV